MKEIILKYLNSNYKFTLSTYVSYYLYDTTNNKEVSLKEALASIILIFDIDETELSKIFDTWADEQAIKINNKITDIRYNLYETTGVELELTPSELNKIIEEEDKKCEEDGITYIPYLPMK